MNDYEKQLEERIDCELKDLPELQAPPALAARIMSAVRHRAARPWYRRSWQAWPVTFQAASLPILLAMFGGLCWSVSALAHRVASVPAVQQVAGGIAGLRVFLRTLNVLGDAVILSFRHFGMGYLAVVFIALFLVYAACVGLGTLSLRLATARSDNNQL